MKKRHNLLILLGFFTLFHAIPLKAENLVTESTLLRIDKIITKKMRRNKIPGLAIAITEGENIVALQGYGVKQVGTDLAVDADTLFHIGSTNKSLTATLAAKLVEEGSYNWSTTVSQILGTDQIDPWLSSVRVDQLINMTGGFVAEDEDNLFNEYGDTPTPENLLQYLTGDFELANEAGTKFEYSNMSAALGGYLSVYATGGNTSDLNGSYNSLLKEKLLTPLGMTRSTIFVSEARSDSNYSVSHVKSGGTVTVATSEDSDFDALAPSGSLKSSAREMAAYIMLHARRGLAPDGTRLLESSTFDTLWQPSAVSGKESYALGWDSKSIRRVNYMMHTGEFDNFSAVIGVLPEYQVGVVLLANMEAVGNLQNRVVKVLFRKVVREARRRAR